jgi:hypothetical protein
MVERLSVCGVGANGLGDCIDPVDLAEWSEPRDAGPNEPDWRLVPSLTVSGLHLQPVGPAPSGAHDIPLPF